MGCFAAGTGSRSTRWHCLNLDGVPDTLALTPRETVLGWYAADANRHRIVREAESEAMAVLVEETQWNGAGCRYCSSVVIEGQEVPVVAVVQDDGQLFAAVAQFNQ